MAPRKPSPRKPARPEKQPEKLTRGVLALCCVGLPLALTAFIIGCCGVAIIMDEPDRNHWYSHTQFGELWRWLTQKNPFYMTICVNGGMVTCLFLGTKLWEHRKALRLEAAAARRQKQRKAE